MKILYVIRHAKSSWDDAALADLQRPLNERGKQDAPEMGKRLAKRKILPDLIISSPAKRAIKTAIKIAHEIQYAEGHIVRDKLFYLAGTSTILSVLHELDDKYESVMIFGHNPGWTDFVNYISDIKIDNIPTCGIVAISFDVDHWSQIGEEKGNHLFFDYPKRIF